jgi:hypothetical protein
MLIYYYIYIIISDYLDTIIYYEGNLTMVGSDHSHLDLDHPYYNILSYNIRCVHYLRFLFLSLSSRGERRDSKDY